MCPKCGSLHLKIKQTTGIERILILWTRERRYKCSDCFHSFRAKDRRSIVREPLKTPSAPHNTESEHLQE
jgi:transposase-like protein